VIQALANRGIHLPGQQLWLDPWDPRDFAFVSHAHADHIAPHSHLLASPDTLKLLKIRLPASLKHTALPFHTPHPHNQSLLQILPAGHIAGSAQLHIQDDSGSLLYTGDFSLRPNPSCEPAQWLPAETLLMETTFGLPHFQFPPTERTVSEILDFCSRTLADDAVPVLLAYPLGKSQEILWELLKAGLPSMLHPSAFALTEVYRQIDPTFPANYRKFLLSEVQGHVLICPPSTLRSPLLSRIRRHRTAILTGWALDPSARFRYGTDAAFPLSDHAGYDDLLRYVDLVQPKRVLTTHGYASEFAADLRRRGIEAWSLHGQNQLELQFGWMPPTSHAPPQKPAPPRAENTSSELIRLALCAEEIRPLSSRTLKLQLLSSFLQNLPPPQLGLAALFLSGRPFPQTDPRSLQTGWSLIRRALLAASGIEESKFREISSRHRDPGPTALEALEHAPRAATFTLKDAATFFDTLAATSGTHRKLDLLVRTFSQIAPLECSYLVRILTGELRMGLGEGLVEEALALASGCSVAEIRQAQMLLGDLAETARRARAGQLATADLEIFRPLQCMLAHPELKPDSAWIRIEESGPAGPWWAEPKLDGIRAQLHFQPPRAELFSRDLRPLGEQFPEIIRAAEGFPGPVVLDGEIVAVGTNGRFSFAQLQKRLGRKNVEDWFSQPVPVLFCCFDLLYFEGRSLLQLPLNERRALLEKLPLPDGFRALPASPVNSLEELRKLFREARGAGHEGLIVKNSASLYSPGQRGLEWLKLKQALGTLDVVVVAAQQGHGRRRHLLSDLTFAVRDPASGTLLPIGKAYSGLTNAELEELTAHFQSTTLRSEGSRHEVLPSIVLEVAFDSLQPSTRHASGLAMRFPRIKSIRKDKPPSEIDTLQSARILAGLPADPP
jgi:DNA ligase-1